MPAGCAAPDEGAAVTALVLTSSSGCVGRTTEMVQVDEGVGWRSPAVAASTEREVQAQRTASTATKLPLLHQKAIQHCVCDSGCCCCAAPAPCGSVCHFPAAGTPSRHHCRSWPASIRTSAHQKAWFVSLQCAVSTCCISPPAQLLAAAATDLGIQVV